jgi:hypothetical protein
VLRVLSVGAGHATLDDGHEPLVHVRPHRAQRHSPDTPSQNLTTRAPGRQLFALSPRITRVMRPRTWRPSASS